MQELVRRAQQEESNLSGDLQQMIVDTRAQQSREVAAELAGVWQEKRDTSINIDKQVGRPVSREYGVFRGRWVGSFLGLGGGHVEDSVRTPT